MDGRPETKAKDETEGRIIDEINNYVRLVAINIKKDVIIAQHIDLTIIAQNANQIAIQLCLALISISYHNKQTAQ